MLGIIFAVVVIGGLICMVIAGTTKDEETKQLAVKGIADAVKAAGAKLVGDEGLIANNAPDDDALAACKALGEKTAAL